MGALMAISLSMAQQILISFCLWITNHQSFCLFSFSLKKVFIHLFLLLFQMTLDCSIIFLMSYHYILMEMGQKLLTANHNEIIDPFLFVLSYLKVLLVLILSRL